jgi:hypothetical protein
MMVTRKNTTPIPMIYNSPEEMAAISNKNETIKEIYNHLNYQKFDRIDAFELIAMVLMACDGKFEGLMKIIIAVFGFTDMQAQ